MRSNQKPPTLGDDERTQTIYRLAAEVIHKQGFDATSMGDIADAVDLTKGGLYYYIKGKQALLFAIMNEALKLLETEVVEPAAKELAPERRLAVLVSGHVRLVLHHTAFMAILATEREALDAEHRGKLAECDDHYPPACSAIASRRSSRPRIRLRRSMPRWPPIVCWVWFTGSSVGSIGPKTVCMRMSWLSNSPTSSSMASFRYPVRCIPRSHSRYPAVGDVKGVDARCAPPGERWSLGSIGHRHDIVD